MESKVNRDWEIVRIFLILGLLTVGFVWGVQSLILTPAVPSRAQNPKSVSQSMDQSVDAEVSLLNLGLIRQAQKIQPLQREPASPEKD